VTHEALTDDAQRKDNQMTTASSADDGPAARDLREQGFATRREVMGDAFVDRAMDRVAGTASEAIQYVVTENVWGNIWDRPGLGRRDRSLLNIGMLVALRVGPWDHGECRNGGLPDWVLAACTAGAKDPPEHPRFGRDAVDRAFCWSTNRSNGSSACPCRECAG
jgi:alkylhydroperoxidase/carboxymuconolactone decarboxylase family protein YurZ